MANLSPSRVRTGWWRGADERLELLVETTLVAVAGEVDGIPAVEDGEPVASQARLQEAADVGLDYDDWCVAVHAKQAAEVVVEERIVCFDHGIPLLRREQVDRLVCGVDEKPAPLAQFGQAFSLVEGTNPMRFMSALKSGSPTRPSGS